MKAKTCQYGIRPVICGRPANTKRQRPGSTLAGWTWDVCDQHAIILDRIRANVARHKPLLDRLMESDWRAG